MASLTPVTPRRAVSRASHLRKMSNGSSTAAPTATAAGSTTATATTTASGPASTTASSTEPARNVVERRCMLWVHDEMFSREDVVLDLGLFAHAAVKAGDLMAIVALKIDSSGARDFAEKSPQPKKEDGCAAAKDDAGPPMASMGADVERPYLFVAKDMSPDQKAKHPNLEVSIAKSIADVFGLKNRTSVLLKSASAEAMTASHVQLSYRDQYLARSDMWRLAIAELSNKTVYKGQKILFMGTIKAQVQSVYVAGRQVQSAFFSTNTRPIFRSESARFVLFIQMSKEMWDFDSEGSGEIMFNKVVNGFLPALFKRWAEMKARHLVSIVLFTRVEYEAGLNTELGSSLKDNAYYTGVQTEGNRKPYKDFYRVVVSEMASGEWTTILYQLKREFRFFRRDISLHRLNTVDPNSPTAEHSMGSTPGTRIEAEPSLAMHGNVLEAINLAATQFANDHIDRDLVRTGISIIVITPGNGLFEVDHDTLKMTAESLIGNGFGIDLVCLPKMPLHSVPLFKYRNPRFKEYHERIQMKSVGSEESTPKQGGIFGSFSSIGEQMSSPSKSSGTELTHRLNALHSNQAPNEWNFAIPHWIDVSFWTGATQDIQSQFAGRVSHGKRRNHTSAGGLDFAVRCKMYELEMASMMDSGMNDMEVLPLWTELNFPSKVVQGKAASGSPEQRHLIDRYSHHPGLSEPIIGPSRQAMEKILSPVEKEFCKALDEIDDVRASGFRRGRRAKFNRVKSFRKTEKAAVKKALADDPKIFGSSVGDNVENKGMHLAEAAMAERKDTLLKREKPRQDSVNSTTSAKLPPFITRPPRFNRQISLGIRGFGVAAPKAAVAELQVEHANAAMSPSISTATANAFDLSRPGTATKSNLVSPAASIKPPERQSSMSSLDKKKEEKSETEKPKDSDKSSQTQPITIKSALQSLESNTFRTRPFLGSLYEGKGHHGDAEDLHGIERMKTLDSQKMHNARLLAGSIPDLPSTLSPTTALAPWLTVLNPCNPTFKDADLASQFKRWQHVFPRPRNVKAMKWKSLCAPASVPLTTEYFPTRQQLTTEYLEKPYNISQDADYDMNEVPRTREEFLRELVGLRLQHGFQIVTGPAIAAAFGQASMNIADTFDRNYVAEDGACIIMSMGNTFHQLSCTNGTEVDIRAFVRKPTAPSKDGKADGAVYQPAIRTTLEDNYETREITLGNSPNQYNWNYVDSFIAGHEEDYNEHLKFWRARFVLIPVERPAQSQRKHGEDNEEEIRLEGIRKLTQMWQRHRFVAPTDRHFQGFSQRNRKDTNPLDIVYQTQDASVIINAELENLPLLEGDNANKRSQLLSNSELFRRSSLNIAALAEAIQQPVEKGGVRMQNRRWHFRLHYNCFIGSDMTTWLLDNFEDIETRDEAVELGQLLMRFDDSHNRIMEQSLSGDKAKDKIFVHVEKRHDFRDGQYFYQMTGDYAKPRPQQQTSWFRKRDQSVPPTPISESVPRDLPHRQDKSRSSSAQDAEKPDSGAATPTLKDRPKVALSKVMKYDVDHRKRSYRPEHINLHYDRLHNPDNCYHIQIDWMNVTAKLIEDAISSWAKTSEQYGLRLVEVPIREACSIRSTNPFRAPYEIYLAVPPPTQAPHTTYFDSTSFNPQTLSTRHYYQVAILKKFNFILDTEAARNFPAHVEVTYSWGKPNYTYSQYIHRTGVILAQIADDGHLILLANRLFNNRTAAIREMDRFAQPHLLERAPGIGARLPHVSGGAHIPPPIGPTSMPGSHMAGIGFRESPASSPVIRPFINSPVLRATSDVLGPSLSGSTVAKLVTPESIRDDLEGLCLYPERLEMFYREVAERDVQVPATPRSPFVGGGGGISVVGDRERERVAGGVGRGNMGGVDEEIPSLGLGPGLLSGSIGAWKREGRWGPIRRGSGHVSDGVGSPRD